MSNFQRLNDPKENGELLEEMKRKLCAAMGIPAEFIEPALTTVASMMIQPREVTKPKIGRDIFIQPNILNNNNPSTES